MCHCWIWFWVPEQLHEYNLHPQGLNVSICPNIMAPYDLGQKGWRISLWERWKAWKAPRVKLPLSCIVNIDAENPFDFAIVILTSWSYNFSTCILKHNFVGSGLKEILKLYIKQFRYFHLFHLHKVFYFNPTFIHAALLRLFIYWFCSISALYIYE